VYRKAAEQSDEIAQVNLGVMYHKVRASCRKWLLCICGSTSLLQTEIRVLIRVAKFFNDWISRKQHNFTESRSVHGM